MRRQDKPPLSPLENEVMSIVWAHGKATAEVVRKQLKSRPSHKESTVRTLLRRLEDKGYVKHTTEGRTYVYSPTTAPHNVAADAVRGIINRLCDGSVENLLIGMVNSEVVSPGKLQELAERIAHQATKPSDKRTNETRTRK